MGKTPKKNEEVPGPSGAKKNIKKRSFAKDNFVSKRGQKVIITKQKKLMIKKNLTKEDLLEHHHKSANLATALLKDRYNIVARDPNNEVYKYFGNLVTKEKQNTVNPTKIFCLICFEENIRREYSERTSSTNLKLHLNKHNIYFAAKEEPQMLENVVLNKSDSNYKQKLSIAIAKLCVRGDLAFNITETDAFNEFCR